MCCGVADIVLSDSAASLTGYFASTATPKKQQQQQQKQKQLQAQKQVSKMG